MEALIREELMSRFLENIQQTKYDEVVEKVLNRNLSPYEAVQFLVNGNISSPLPLSQPEKSEGEENRRRDVTASSS